MSESKCSREGCWNTATTRGLCRKHWEEVREVERAADSAEAAWLAGNEAQRIAIAQAEAQARQKSPVAAILLGVFLGYLGADRFYVGHIGLGIAKLLTCGGAGVWWIIDLFLIGGAVERTNQQSTREAFHRQGLRY